MENQLLVNQLIQDNKGKIYRIIGINTIKGKIFLYDLDKDWLDLIKMDLKELGEAILDGEYYTIDEIYKNVINGRILSQNDIEKRDKAWNIIQGIYEITGDDGILDKKIRSFAIKKMSAKHNISDRTVREYLKRFFNLGMIKDALIPDNRNSGRKTNSNATENKMGEKRICPDAKGISIDDNIQKIFKTSINKFYNTSKKASLKTAYELMVKEYFSTRGIGDDGRELIKVNDPSNLPTFSQFKYWHYKNRDLIKEIIGRDGAKNYNLKSRAVLHSSTDEAISPASIYQVDATIGDFYLVSSYNNKEIIGRPTIYLVLDVFTRMVCGVHISLGSASYINAAMALLNSATDKKKFCSEYDIDIISQEWPAKHICKRILADRGELESTGIETVVEKLGLHLSNTASYRGDMKAIVERYFKLLQDAIKPFLTGVIRDDFQKRGAPDYRLTATLNLHQFTKIVIKTIIYLNNSYLPAYERDEAMISDNVSAIPTELWEWGIRNRSGSLRHVDEDILKFYLLPRDKARVTGKGIVYKNIRYTCDKALKERWFERARENGSWSIDIMFDPRIAEYIYILDKNSDDYQKCTLLSNSSRYNNKSFYDVDFLLEKEKKEKTVLEYEKLQSKVNLINDIEDIVNESIEGRKTKTKDIKSKKARLKNIKENKIKEILIEDKEKGIRLKEQEQEIEVEENSVIVEFKENLNDTNNSTDELFRIQEEMLND
ncbi:MAG: Mu transposase C-terminal domain-containing protein [Gudongella sp.]|nr:Mu transposase C-terminal domain-containing protein [Gudongella sp.]